jgi:hypothetical protein
MNCTKCGIILNSDAKYCSNCGCKIERIVDSKKQKIEELVNCLIRISDMKSNKKDITQKVNYKPTVSTKSNDSWLGCLGCLGIIIILFIIVVSCTNSISDNDDFDNYDPNYDENYDYDFDGDNDADDVQKFIEWKSKNNDDGDY